MSFANSRAVERDQITWWVLSRDQRASPHTELDLIRVDCKRQSRIVNCLWHRDLTDTELAHLQHVCLMSTAPLSRQESSRFCPRVFGHFRYFSQKSALKWPEIRAPDWTYAGPREPPDVGNIRKQLPRWELTYEGTCIRSYAGNRQPWAHHLCQSHLLATYIYDELQLVNINCQRMFLVL